MPVERVTSSSTEETDRLAGEFVRRVRPGDWVGLTGPLGAGKSVWVRGMARALGVTDPVVSPSFTLVNVYRGQVNLCHVDLYRLRAAEEVIDFGLDTLNDEDTVVVVEWAERLSEAKLPFRWIVDIQRTDETRRNITVDELVAADAEDSRL